MTSILLFDNLTKHDELPTSCTITANNLAELRKKLANSGVNLDKNLIFTPDLYWKFFENGVAAKILGGRKYSALYGFYVDLGGPKVSKYWLPKLLVLTLRLACLYSDNDQAFQAISYLNKSLNLAHNPDQSEASGYDLGELIQFPKDKALIWEFWQILIS